jgi:hypothetical protein
MAALLPSTIPSDTMRARIVRQIRLAAARILD